MSPKGYYDSPRNHPPVEQQPYGPRDLLNPFFDVQLLIGMLAYGAQYLIQREPELIAGAGKKFAMNQMKKS